MTDFYTIPLEINKDTAVWSELVARGPDLYAEYCRNPIGAHSPDLQFVLQHFRKQPVAGKFVLVAKVPHKTWVLGKLTGVRGDPVKTDDSVCFHSLDEAERYVFRLRWKALTGIDLDPERSA